MIDIAKVCGRCSVKNCNETYVGCKLRQARVREKEKKRDLAEKGLRECTQCREIKPLTEFYRRKDGHQSECKVCAKKRRIPQRRNMPRGRRAGDPRVCRICGKKKPATEFYWRRDTGTWHNACRECYIRNTQRRGQWLKSLL